MKTALVHDYLAQAGGAERVAAAFHNLFPEAPLYTSVYDPAATLDNFAEMDIRTSFLQRWPFSSRRFHKLALPYYPSAFERFNFTGYDLVLSSSSSFAKGVITPPEACHICYCHTPSRFVWRQQEYLAQTRSARAASALISAVVNSMRSWDVESAQRVDYFIANSYNVARRIRKFYRRDVAAVIYPPVETTKFRPVSPEEVGDHFLVVSRLLNYKRLDLAVQACTRLNLPLRVVGIGPDLPYLKRMAGPTIQFLGRLPDKQVAQELAHCKALIFPGEEDFGITPVECMASGRPVIAYGAGGALETVVDGETGLFFAEQTVDSLVDALIRIDQISFSTEALQKRASCFDTSVFEAQMLALIKDALEEHQNNNSVTFINRKSLDHDKRMTFQFSPKTLSETFVADNLNRLR
ncbi:MAG: glycosyltransferase [Janthinobacterium lividum]